MNTDTCPTHQTLIEAVHLGATQIVVRFACGCKRKEPTCCGPAQEKEGQTLKS